MAPKTPAKPDTKPEERNDSERRSREAPRADIWDIKPDGEVDKRFIITDWASI